MASTQKDRLRETVIDNDYCIGCGACSYASSDYEVNLDVYGMLKAKNTPAEEGSSPTPTINAPVEEVCPFSNESMNEDEIAAEKFADDLPHDDRIGKYISTFAGHVTIGDYRAQGSSGGFGKWMLAELLARDKVDTVLQVAPNSDEDSELFGFAAFDSAEEIINGSRSAYYPVSYEGAFEHIRENEGRYAITALPCFSKALELVRRQDDIIDERVEYTVGLVCGHLKSKAFAESFAWQLGVHPDDLAEFEFRGETQGEKANEKGVYAIDTDGNKTETVSSRDLLGGDWGHGFFKYKACDYCDDVVAETADVTFGDAWIPPYEDDPAGANVVVTRNEEIEKIVRDSIDNGALAFDEITAEDVAESQAGGLRHRRKGLSYRLARQEEQGNWYPKKRVEPDKSGTKRDLIYEKRVELRERSHELFQEAKDRDDFEYFRQEIQNDLHEYDVAYRGGQIRYYLVTALEELKLKEALKTSRNKAKALLN